MLALSLAELQPFLTPNPLPAAKASLVTAWCPVLDALLNTRYGERITFENAAVFASAAADAIQRRLDRSQRGVASQSVNGASVSYSASLWAWFYASELAELDALVGAAGVRSVRMSAPDATRFGNRLTRRPSTDPWDECYEV